MRITSSGNETLAIRTGSYSTTIAAQIAEGNSSVNLPIQWGSWTYPYQIETGSTRQCYGEHCLTETTYGTGYTTGITGTAFGGPLVAATIGQNTTVWDGTTKGPTVTGWNPHIAGGQNYAVLTTQTSTGVDVSTFYGAVLGHQVTLNVAATDSAAVWLPNEAGGEEGVIISTASGAIQFYDSVDAGFTFQGPYTIASYTQLASNRTALDAIGSTQLTNPYGWPGQVSATVVGDTAMVVYTTAVGGVTAAATAVSVNPTATKWVSGYTTPPSLGSVAYPALVATPMGYVYATWIQDNLQTWSVQLAAFNAAGQPIQAPSALPGTVSSTSPQTVSPPAISIDLFARPFIIWAINPGGGAPTTMRYTGAYLSASNSLKLLEAQLNELEPGDFLAQTPGSLVTGLTSDLTTDLNMVGKITSSKSTFTYLCQAANLTANTIYTNVSHIEFSLATDLCGNFGWVEKETTPPVLGSTVTGPPPNSAWNPSIATASGPMTAQNYLTTIADWALMALGVSMGWMGSWGSTQSEVQNLPYTPVTASTSSSTVDSKEFTVSATPVVLSPTEVELKLSSDNPYPTYETNWETDQNGVVCQYTESTTPTIYYTNVTVNGAAKSFTSTSSLIQDLYLTNLSSDAVFNWSESLRVLLEGYEIQSCPHIYQSSYVNPPTEGLPRSLTLSPSGSVSTSLNMFTTSNPTPVSVVNNTFVLQWSNSMPAYANASMFNLNTGSGRGLLGSGWSTSEDFPFGSDPSPVSGDWFQAGYSANSWDEGWNSTQEPSFSLGEAQEAGLSASAGCTFEYEATSTPTIAGLGVIREAGGNATVEWNSSVDGASWVEYYEAGTQFNLTQTAAAGVANGQQWEYVVQLHGLAPLSWYGITANTADVSGCLSVVGSATALYVSSTTLSISATAWSYDSISKTGGGEGIFWTLSRNITTFGTFDNGSIVYANLTSHLTTTVLTFSTLQNWTHDPVLYFENLTLTSLNTSYRAQLFLNFTVPLDPWTGVHSQSVVTFQSQIVTFVYLPDTSGDGLSDVEKVQGWAVPVPNATGAATQLPADGGMPATSVVTASPALYTTNGLVNDYVEKEYSLDPNTVDTAGSHMLDTWNLTFNLAPGKGRAPALANLEYWNESSSYNPFASSVRYSPGHFETGNPIAHNITNISASSSHGMTSGDGAPWAAQALWSYSALQSFVNLSGVLQAGWLRAVLGSWDGVPTLTIWGKLSWGANPLIASTPGDGIPDGERVNPVVGVALEFDPVFANVTGTIYSGDEYSAQMSYSYWTPQHGFLHVTNYSTASVAGGDAPIANYAVTLPVGQVNQTLTIELEVGVWNTGSFSPVKLNGTRFATNVTYDLVKGGTLVTSPSGTHGNLHGTFVEVPLGAKDPTWLWLPTDNSTVNGLPAGLERYTGEQSFDIVVVDASGSISSQAIPLPWGGDAAAITLSAGLNTFLIPREQFLDSPFGEAILLGKNTTYNSSDPIPPLVGSSGKGVISHFGGANWMVDLGAYWQNRAIASGPGNITGSTETGTSNTNSLNVNMTLVTTGSTANVGGVPSVPGLYNSSDPAPPAVQSIFTLNITNQTTLDLLLAGLFDNTSGGSNGVNGTFQSIASEVPILGFESVIANALPNQTELSDGLYGPYTSGYTGPSNKLWGDFWNAVSSVIENPSGAILSLATIVWSATEATATFFNHLAHEAAALGAEALSRAAAALVILGKIIVEAVNAVIQYILQLIRAALSQALVGFLSAITAFGASASGSLSGAISDVVAGRAVTEPDATSFWTTLTGTLFLAGVAIATAAEIAIGLLTPFSLGASFLVGILIGILLSTVLQSLESTPGAHAAEPRGITAISGAAIYACEGAANSTNPPPRNEPNWSTNWNALAGVANWATTLYSTQIGFGLLGAAYFEGNGLLLPAVSFGLGLVGIALGIAGAATGNRVVQETNVGVSLTSVVLDGVDLAKYPEDRVGPLGALNGLTAILDVTSFTIGLAELLTGG